MTQRLTIRLSGTAVLAAVALALAVPRLASAHDPRADSRPPALQDVAFDQRVNAPVPLQPEFRDETGRTVRLGDYFGTRPVVLALVYHRCRDLCPLLLEGATRALRGIAFTPGREYSLVVLSFDPRDTPAVAAARKADLIQRSGMPGAADWHFLTGEASAVRAVTDAVGFRYSYDAKADQFAHASGLVLLTPQGTIFRYMYGIEFSPEILRLGLVEASQDRAGSVVDQALLFCYHYDPSTGTYTLAIMNLLRAAGLVTVGAMGAFIVLMWRRDRRRARVATEGV
jgi:protein SCO1/2